MSVDRTENKNSRKGLAQVGYCLKYLMNFLRAVLEGVHREFTTRAVLQKYNLGSSANVSIVKRALLKKELIEMEKRQVVIPDPVMEEWLRRELGL